MEVRAVIVFPSFEEIEVARVTTGRFLDKSENGLVYKCKVSKIKDF